jgi:hypothetical protein
MMGDDVTMSMRVSSDVQCLEVHLKMASFFNRDVRGLAKWVKFGIKGHW